MFEGPYKIIIAQYCVVSIHDIITPLQLWFYILHVFTRDDSSQLGLNLSKGITKLSLPAIAMLL